MAIKLKGHETFVLREGWLNKGMRAVATVEKVFSVNYGADALGVGSNMAKSIRYWMRAGGYLDDSNKSNIKLTDIGRIIYKNDPYLEDDFALWIFHVNLALDKDYATSWYLFFNEIEADEFTREELSELLRSQIIRMTGDEHVSERSIRDDAAALINMYVREKIENYDPEDKKISPFARLGLVKKSGNRYQKTQPIAEELDELVVLYLLQTYFLESKETGVSIDKLLHAPKLVGKVLHLKRVMLNEYLDSLAIEEIDPVIKDYQMKINSTNVEIEALLPAIELKKKYDQMCRERNKAEEDKQIQINHLLENFSNLTVDYMSMPLVKDSLMELKSADKLDKGIPKLHADTIKFLLNRKICICGEPLVPGEKHYDELYALLDVVPPKSLGQAIADYATQVQSSTKIAKTYKDVILSKIQAVRKIAENIDSLNRKISEAYEELTNTDKARILKDRLATYTKTAAQLSNEMADKNKEIGALDTQRKYYEAEKEKLLLLDKKNEKNRKFYEYAKYIYEVIATEYATKEEQVRSELQDTINDIFNEIYAGSIRLEVDSRYNVKVLVDDIASADDELERNTAQNYAIIFAFISGIIRMSKEKRKELNELYGIEEDDDEYHGYPLVMDAPLSAFDKRRIANICETIPNIAQQVIIFIKDTDGEVAEKYMAKDIGMQYALVADSQTVTHVEKR